MFSRFLHRNHDRRHSFQKYKLVFLKLSFKTKQMMYNFIDKLYNFSTFSFSTKIKQFWGKNDEKWEFANFIDLSFEKKKKENVWTFGRRETGGMCFGGRVRKDVSQPQQKSCGICCMTRVLLLDRVIYFSPLLQWRPTLHHILLFFSGIYFSFLVPHAWCPWKKEKTGDPELSFFFSISIQQLQQNSFLKQHFSLFYFEKQGAPCLKWNNPHDMTVKDHTRWKCAFTTVHISKLVYLLV